MMNNRKGVSLITVLMFMLVATIAATATFKWLSSEGSSSADRMLVNEARASAVAGVEAARAWMTYHGNETGAILKQFMDESKKKNAKTPIRLDNVLAPMAKDGQSYSVSLVDVEASGALASYKIRIVSKGEARNGRAEYTESAVMTVSGLYQVPIPQPEAVAPYHYAYFGGSTSFSGEHNAAAMLINGNWGFGTYSHGSNPGHIDNDFIVTGNAALSGNNIFVGGTACIGGNLEADNGMTGKELYVAGNATKNMYGQAFVAQLSGDAYFNGNVDIGNQAKPGFYIGGNMTLNGRLSTNLGAFDHTVDGDLCLGEDGYIKFSDNEGDDRNMWTVTGNVYMPNSYKMQDVGIYKGNGIQRYKNRIFGNKKASKVFIKDAFRCDDYYCDVGGKVFPYTASCEVNGALVAGQRGTKKSCQDSISYQRHMNGNTENSYSSFYTKGVVEGAAQSKAPFQCANAVRAHCDSVWHKVAPGEQTCDNAPYKVNDILTTSYESFKGFASTIQNSGIADCRNITSISPENTQKMNSCYSKLAADKEKSKKYLYNGFAVFSLLSDENSSTRADESNAPKLNGKFIFIYESPLQGNNPHFPKTENSARVFVYLRQGANVNRSNPDEGTKINCNSGATYNYFFYTKGSIAGLLGTCTWNGSFYATAASCAKISNVNGSVGMEYDPDVVNDMSKAGIICPNDGSPCGGEIEKKPTPSDPGSSSSGEVEESDYDSLFVTTGDHLVITVESEYKSKEKVPNSTVDVAPSMMVFPRVIYLNQDAIGKLSDYYSVIPLNGLKMTGTGTLTSSAALAPPTSGKLIPKKDAVLTKGIYDYTYTYTEDGKTYKSDFYVVVVGVASETPLVHFAGSAYNAFTQGVSNSMNVDLTINGSNSTGEVAVKISVSENLSGWNITKPDGSSVPWSLLADGTRTYVFKGNMSADSSVNHLFKITTASDAGAGTIRFTLQSPENCVLGGGPIVKTFNIKGNATVHRGSLKDYCRTYPEQCKGEADSLKTLMDLDDCPDVSSEWVKINCIGSSTIRKNEEWRCDAGVGSANVVKLTRGTYPSDKCVLVVPYENNFIDNPQDDKSHPGGYALYADLKRKAYKLKVDMDGAHSSSKINVAVGERYDGPYTTISPENCVEGVCTYIVYANQYFRLTPDLSGGDGFSLWVCNSCTATGERKSTDNPYRHIMDKDFYITAQLNRKDDHCFSSEFENTAIWCTSDMIDCINYCKNNMASCSVLDGHMGYKNPNWVMVNSRGGSDKKLSTDFGYLKTSSTNPSVMLSSVDGGPEGDFTIRMRTDVVSKILKSKLKTALINSGVILRSNDNASEYILVNVFGTSLTGGAIATETFARVCYIKDVVSKTNDDNCTTVTLKEKNLGITSMPWIASTQLNFTLSLDGDELNILGSYSHSAKLYEVSASVDLKTVVKQGDFTLNDDDHNRVGLKVGDSEFGVFDATWHSKKYDSDCFADPKISCSFTAKYMGGQIPLNETVSPAIGFSSWFAGKGGSCIANAKYYYNGCDLPPSNFLSYVASNFICSDGVCDDGLVENFIGNDGTRVSNGEYYFRCEGAHGFRHATRNGYVRNASVEVNCNSVNGMKYTANCGDFYVGELHNCELDETILDYPKNGGVLPVTVNSSYGTVYNLRDADLIFDMVMNPGSNVRVTLEDVNKNQSDAFILTQSGENTVSYSKFSNNYGFNPEKVTKITLRGMGGTTFVVNSIMTHCAHTLKVYCGPNDAMFDAGIWRVKANIQPFESAKKCLVKSENKDVDSWFGDCNEAGEFFIEDPEFLERVNNATSETSMEFAVSVFEDENATENSEPTSTCIATSQTYKPVTLTCDYAGDQRDFVQGAGVPALVFEAGNCPADGCEFEANLSDGTVYVHDTKASGSMTWPANSNSVVGLTPGDYSYEVKIYSDASKSKLLNKCVTPPFKVIQAKEAEASSCRVLDGRFYAFVNGSNFETVSASLVYTDMIGNPFASKNVAVNTNESVEFDLRGLSDGDYILTLTLNGKDACSQAYSKGSSASPIGLTCPGDINGQSKSGGITITPKVTGCENSDCSYSVTPGTSGTSGTNWNGSTFSFYDVEGEGMVSYTLKVSKSGATDKTCGFNVTFSSGTTSATCSLDKSEVHVGESVAFGVTNMQPKGNQVHFEVFKGSDRVYDNTNWWPDLNFPQGGSDYIKMETEGSVVLTAKINGNTVCTKTVTVKKEEQGAYYFKDGNLNAIPPADTPVKISMPGSCGGSQLGVNGNTANCKISVNGTDHDIGWYNAVSVSGTFTFINRGGCVSQIRCW